MEKSRNTFLKKNPTANKNIIVNSIVSAVFKRNSFLLGVVGWPVCPLAGLDWLAAYLHCVKLMLGFLNP
jgi:hypothetical protein